MYAQTKHPTESFCVYAKPILWFNIDCGENDFSVERSENRFLICDNIDFRELCY